MNWIDAIYKNLDETYAEDLEKFQVSSEEIVKEMWLALRNRLMKEDAEDVMIHYFGTFNMKSGKLFNLIFLSKAAIEVERSLSNPDNEFIEQKLNNLKKYMLLYNNRVKYNKRDKRKLSYNEKTNEVFKDEELVTNKSYLTWIKRMQNAKRTTKQLD